MNSPEIGASDNNLLVATCCDQLVADGGEVNPRDRSPAENIFDVSGTESAKSQAYSLRCEALRTVCYDEP